jgi:chitin synthase
MVRHWKTLGKALFFQGRLSGPLGLSNIHHQPLQRTSRLLSRGFLDRNLDSLSPGFVSLLRGNTTGYEATAGEEGSGSTDPFVRRRFSGKEIAMQMHPRNETVVVAQQPVKRVRNHSTRWKNTVKHAPTLGDVEEKECDDDDMAPTILNNSSPCVAGEFRSARRDAA